MTKNEGLFVIVISFQIFVTAIILCYFYQFKENEKKMFSRIETKISEVQEKDKSQDELIQSIIKHQVMAGMFDKKDMEE